MTSPALSLPLSDSAAWPASSKRPTTLQQSLLLALLLHVLAVVMLGSTPDGSARPGEGVWGLLNVTLQGEPSQGGADAQTVPDATTGPPGPADHERFGGVVRQSEAPAATGTSPGAQKLGHWRATPTPTPSPAPTPAPEPAPVLPSESAEPVLRTPSAAVAPEVAPDIVPPAPAPELPPPVRMTAPPPPMVEPIVRPDAVRISPQGLAVPAPVVAPEPAPVLPDVVRAQPAVPIAPPPVAPLQVPDIERALPMPAPAVSRAAPVVATQPSPTVSPATAPAPRAEPITRSPDISSVPASTTPSPSTTPAARSPTGDISRPTSGSPDAGARVGHDVATAPSASASAPAPLNLSLPSLRGGEISGRGSRGLFQAVPHPPEEKSKLAKDIEKSAEPDCRTAYAGAGLLAVVPLVADTVKGTGCRW